MTLPVLVGTADGAASLVGDGDGGVDAAAEADVIEGVDDLGEDEGVDHAGVGDGPGEN